MYWVYAQKYPTFASIQFSAHSHWPRPDSFGLTFDTKKKRVLHLKVVIAHVFFIVYMVLSWRKLKRMDEICIVFRQWFRFSFYFFLLADFVPILLLFFVCCGLAGFYCRSSFDFSSVQGYAAQNEKIYSFQWRYWLFVALTKCFRFGC